jgi:hypothetical protein
MIGNWNKRYASEKRRYRKYNYREVDSPGPDNGGIPFTHPFIASYLDQLESELHYPGAYRGADSQGRTFVEHNGMVKPIEHHIDDLNKLREIQKNPNSIIGVSREFSFGGDSNPKEEEHDINPGDHVAMNLNVKENKIYPDGADKLIPARHYYINPESFGALVWGGYHPRRGLSRGLGVGGYNKTTVEESARKFLQQPALGREYSVEDLKGKPKKIYSAEQLDTYNGDEFWRPQ